MNTIEYKVIFLYFKKSFTTQEIALVLNISLSKIDNIIDQEWRSIQTIQKVLLIDSFKETINGEKIC
jgi:DNA-directed RNA polymerase specialized sigma subunit